MRPLLVVATLFATVAVASAGPNEEYETALTAYRAAPSDTDATLDLIQAEALTFRLADASQRAHAFVSAHPDIALGHFLEGYVAYVQGDLGASREQLAAALALDPRNQPALALRAELAEHDALRGKAPAPSLAPEAKLVVDFLQAFASDRAPRSFSYRISSSLFGAGNEASAIVAGRRLYQLAGNHAIAGYEILPVKRGHPSTVTIRALVVSTYDDAWVTRAAAVRDDSSFQALLGWVRPLITGLPAEQRRDVFQRMTRIQFERVITLEADLASSDYISDLRINGVSVATFWNWDRPKPAWRPGRGLWRRWRWYYALPALVAGMFWLGREVIRRRANSHR